MARGARLPALAKGIYPDRFGFEVRVSIKGKVYPARFPPGTDLAVMQQWQADETAWRLRQATDDAHVAPERGTLKSDVGRYLTKREGRSGYKSDRSHLQAWVNRYGGRTRASLKPHDIDLAIAAWRTAGKSPKTIRHRVRVGKELWRSLDGKQTRTPFDNVELPTAIAPNPIPVPLATIQKVAASLKRGLVIEKACGPQKTVARVHTKESAKTYARFLVRAVCGQRPSQVMWAESGDVDLVRKIWFVRSAKGGTQIPLPLGPEGVKAWKTFIAADAWGAFDTRSFSKTIKRHGWPAGVRPYVMRHTYAIDHLLAGTPIGDVQGLLGHKDITTTRRFYAPVLVALLKKAVGRRKLKL